MAVRPVPRLMLNLYPRLATDGAPVGAAALDDDDDEEPHVCYGIMVAFVSLLLFCVLLAVVSPARACAITSLLVLLFGVAACVVPTRGTVAAAARADRSGAGMGTRQPAPVLRLARRCTCGMTDAAIGALPTFAYGSPAAADAKGGEEPRGSCAPLLCAVCLEDVLEGEMVRQLPPCRHLFHVECIDLWLRTRRTCPLCRCELSPPKVAAKPAAAATESSAHALPLPPV
nr:E3 ubiquitin-protein ligase Os03g0188200-like [Lolium perenne]